MKKMCMLVLVLVLLSIVMPCLAQEAVEATAVAEETSMLDNILGNSTILESIFQIIAVIAVFIFGKMKVSERLEKIKDDKARAAASVLAEATEVGVVQTYEAFVKACKTKAADGKLTAEERKEAAKKATDVAVEYAKKKGIDLLKEYGDDVLKVAIEKAVSIFKKKK